MRFLDKLVAAVKRYPVRVRAYTVVGVVLGYLVYAGHIDVVSAETAFTVLGTVLGVKETERHTVPVVKASRRKRRR